MPSLDRAKVHLALLVLITAGAVAHHVVLWNWFVEDAAISFAYARNLAHGEGLVPFVGGERVEGYSNPAWVLLLAPFYGVGLGPWMYVGVRWIQLVLAALTVPATYFATREGAGRDSPVPLLAAAVLAASSQFAIWGSAGLESSLMNFLMAIAIWRSLVEVRTGRWPWSALLWLAVALCRPEAILYAAVAGFSAMVASLHARRGPLPTAQWLLMFFLPFGLYHAARYQYFAWEWPNTYYAKLERRPGLPWLDFHKKSWRYTRDFMHELGWGFFLPVWFLGAIGHRGWRLPTAATLAFAVALVTQLASNQRYLVLVVVSFTLIAFWMGLRASDESPPPGLALGGLGVAIALVAISELLRDRGMLPNPLPSPAWIKQLAPLTIVGAAGLLTVLSVGARGWHARMLTFLLCLAAVTFAVIAQWDWMKGYRWYAPAVVPGAILFALGVESFARVVQEALHGTREGWLVSGVLTALAITVAIIPPNVVHTALVRKAPDTDPMKVKARVDFVKTVQQRLHIDGRLVDLDVDQGAHLLWSDFEMLDIAGLIDVPLGHHKFERAFLQEYVFAEQRPHFAHVHDSWANQSRIPTLPEWRKDYVKIQGYVASRTQFHIGNYVRRDLIMTPRRPQGDAPTALEDGVLVHGVAVPAAPGAGRHMHVEVGLGVTKPGMGADDDFRVLLFAAGAAGVLATWDVPPGYGWLLPHDWEGQEVFLGKHDLPLPDALVPGTYDLGLVVIGADGAPLSPIGDDATPREAGPVFAAGEVLFPGALTVLSVEARATAASTAREQAIDAAASGDCDAAEHSWVLARNHRAAEHDWAQTHAPRIHRAVADCHALASDDAPDRPARIASLVRARQHDHWSPPYRTRAGSLAAELMAEGHAAREAEDWETAYRRFADAVAVDRTQSWARRYAEEARAHRLGFAPVAELADEEEQG